jgi:hypothetical protein
MTLPSMTVACPLVAMLIDDCLMVDVRLEENDRMDRDERQVDGRGPSGDERGTTTDEVVEDNADNLLALVVVDGNRPNDRVAIRIDIVEDEKFRRLQDVLDAVGDAKIRDGPAAG